MEICLDRRKLFIIIMIHRVRPFLTLYPSILHYHLLLNSLYHTNQRDIDYNSVWDTSSADEIQCKSRNRQVHSLFLLVVWTIFVCLSLIHSRNMYKFIKKRNLCFTGSAGAVESRFGGNQRLDGVFFFIKYTNLGLKKQQLKVMFM